jgi:hypothetical protein
MNFMGCPIILLGSYCLMACCHVSKMFLIIDYGHILDSLKFQFIAIVIFIVADLYCSK